MHSQHCDVVIGEAAFAALTLVAERAADEHRLRRVWLGAIDVARLADDREQFVTPLHSLAF